MSQSLRPYQHAAVEALRHSLQAGYRRPVLVSPTGSGKTNIAAAVVRGALDKNKRVLFLAPRRELIDQACNRLLAHGITPGVIMAGEPRSPYQSVQVASFDTLHARGVRSERMLMPDADVLIVDEAHLSVAPTRKAIIDCYPNAVVIGLTATPARSDGTGLGAIYDHLVETVTMRELVNDGFLVPALYYAPSKPDLEGLKIARGDYVIKELGKRMDQPQLVGDVVRNWFRLARERRTVVFCVTRAHSRHVCAEFKARGIVAEHLDGETPLDERKAILKRVATGATQVLCNVFVATFGLDIPALDCCVLARPTRNISTYLQTVGRVLRSCDGKTDALIIDHAGAVSEHGFVDDPVPWSLDGKETVKERKQQAQQERREPKEITCGDCGTVFRGARVCPNCGYEMILPGKPVPTYQANLQEVGRGKAGMNRNSTWEDKVKFFGQLKSYCLAQGFNLGWTSHKYRERFGVWPNDPRLRAAPEIPVTPEVAKWIKSRNIRHAKRRVA